MNKVILMGRFTREPEIRYTQGAEPMTIAKFGFAVPRKYKRENEPECDFINCTAFGKPADFINKYAYKGIKLLIEGRWQTGSYTNREGQRVYTNDCIIESCEFVESKNVGQPKAEQATDKDYSGFVKSDDIDDSDLPF